MINDAECMEYKRLLIVSHNALSNTKGNGKILTSLFCNWPKEKIAQLYFWNEWPDQTVCERFFRLRDHDILRANLTGKPAEGAEIDARALGKIISSTDVVSCKGFLSSMVYRVFNKRTPVAELIRDAMWRQSKYVTPKLVKWLDEFRPEVVFFQGSHMPFAYKMCLWICKRYGAQLQIVLSDDYSFVTNRISPFAYLNSARYIKWFKQGLAKSSGSYAVVPAMKTEYERRYECGNIFVASNCLEVRPFDDEEDISGPNLRMLYAGNVGLNRWRALRKLGRCLAKLKNANLEIYTPSPISEKIKQALTIEGVMSYRGSLGTEELLQTIKQSNVLVHVESFDRKNMRVTRMSLSTKIPESLMSGRCLLAIGPRGISSIDYLEHHRAALVLSDQRAKSIREQIVPIFNAEYRKNTARTAYKLAIQNHDVEKIRKLIWQNAQKTD